MANGKDGYIFQRNIDGTTRLNCQYYLWQDTLRFHLHPSIPLLSPDARIADVATGSGIWLCDLSRKLPSRASLAGSDISLEQIPHRSTLSPNLEFHAWNFFEPASPELLSSFDVVHMRLIAVVIKDADAKKVLNNVKKLLKPGGYLQWEEHYTKNIEVLTAAGKGTSEYIGLTGLRDMLAKPVKSTSGQLLIGPREWLETLESTLESQGFEDVHRFVYPDTPHMGIFWTDIYIASAEEFARQILEQDPELASTIKEITLNAHKKRRTKAWVSNSKNV